MFEHNRVDEEGGIHFKANGPRPAPTEEYKVDKQNPYRLIPDFLPCSKRKRELVAKKICGSCVIRFYCPIDSDCRPSRCFECTQRD